MDMADDTTATDSVSTSWGSLQALELLNASSAMPTPCPSPEFRRPKRPSFRHEEGWEDEESYAAFANISDDTVRFPTAAPRTPSALYSCRGRCAVGEAPACHAADSGAG